MSNLHAYADDLELQLTSGAGLLGAVRNAALAAVATIRASVERRQAQRHIARLPDHLLRDFGYERDWDGTVRSLGDND